MAAETKFRQLCCVVHCTNGSGNSLNASKVGCRSRLIGLGISAFCVLVRPSQPALRMHKTIIRIYFYRFHSQVQPQQFPCEFE